MTFWAAFAATALELAVCTFRMTFSMDDDGDELILVAFKPFKVACLILVRFAGS